MSTRTLYVATGNVGKLLDFATAATTVDSAWRIEPLPGLADIAAPPEDSTTFEANAQSKALYYGAFLPNEWVLADDSGLEVDTLNGAPGVYSARYAERLGVAAVPSASIYAGTNQLNNACLLLQIAASKQALRTARYRCALAVAQGGGIVAQSQGTVEGEILSVPRGAGGFGYDPLFYLPKMKRTMAELGREERLSVNHRGAALRNLLEQFAPSSKIEPV